MIPLFFYLNIKKTVKIGTYLLVRTAADELDSVEDNIISHHVPALYTSHKPSSPKLDMSEL